MQVAEFIQLLRKVPQEAEVVFRAGSVLSMSEVEREKLIIDVPVKANEQPTG